MFLRELLCICLVGISVAPPPPLSPRVNHLLNQFNLNEYNGLMINEEIDLPVLAQLSEEQLSRMGVRTMGQRIRILNAAKDALAASDQVEQNVIESVGQSENSDEGEEEELEGEDIDEEGDDEDEGEEEALEGELEDEEDEDGVQFELVAKTTTTGKRTHMFNVGDNRYLGRGIKKNGQCFF